VGGYTADQYHGFLRDVDGSYTTINTPFAYGTNATGINASGQIVGSYYDFFGTYHGFLATPVP
jgi:hypothetical protein